MSISTKARRAGRCRYPHDRRRGLPELKIVCYFCSKTWQKISFPSLSRNGGSEGAGNSPVCQSQHQMHKAHKRDYDFNSNKLTVISVVRLKFACLE